MKRTNKLFFCRLIDTYNFDAPLQRVDKTQVVRLCSSDFSYLLNLGFLVVVCAADFCEPTDPFQYPAYTRALRRAHRVCKYIMYNRSLPNKL